MVFKDSATLYHILGIAVWHPAEFSLIRNFPLDYLLLTFLSVITYFLYFDHLMNMTKTSKLMKADGSEVSVRIHISLFNVSIQ